VAEAQADLTAGRSLRSKSRATETRRLPIHPEAVEHERNEEAGERTCDFCDAAWGDARSRSWRERGGRPVLIENVPAMVATGAECAYYDADVVRSMEALIKRKREDPPEHPGGPSRSSKSWRRWTTGSRHEKPPHQRREDRQNAGNRPRRKPRTC